MKGAKRKNDGPLQLEGLTTAVCVRQKGGGGGGEEEEGESLLLVCALLSLKI